ncbi:MAG: hypothetical protein LBJ12_08140 [Oscillospiraceae bacterium]|jgi:YbbR domain-containing protein|nr:hypothetical protein [Oscillospiraceae bacterium]
MKPRRKLRKIFASNPFVLGLSFVLAFVIWLMVTVSVAPEEERTLAHIPVSIELTDAVQNLNLEAFTAKDGYFIDVTIKGKRYVLNEITPEQINVRAQTATVGSAGLKSLRLSATSSAAKDFQIVRLSQQEINVLFDERKEQDFQLETVLLDSSGKPIKNMQSAAPKGYLVDHELLSTSSVTLVGPASEIARIKSVTATAQLTETLTETAAFTAAIAPQTSDGAALQFVTVQAGDEITMTIPVYKRVTLPITVEWLNAPAAYAAKPLSIVCNPKTAQFGISESLLDEITAVTVGTVDFAKLPAGQKNEFKFPAAEVRQFKLLSNEESFRVTVDTTGKKSANYAVPHSNIQLQNAAPGITVQVAPGMLGEVTVAGSSTGIDKLEGGDIYAEADLGEVKAQNGEVTVPARVFVKGYDDCWVIGEYKVTLVVTVS